MTKSNRTRRGFTLIEVMIVVVIILALSGLGALALFGKKGEAEEKLARVDLNTIVEGLDFFRLAHGRFPTDEEGLEVLWSKDVLDPDTDETAWSRILKDPMPRDRWNNEWQYVQEGEHEEGMYDLWSYGPDGEDGTDDDITSWNDAEDSGGGFDDSFAPPPSGG